MATINGTRQSDDLKGTPANDTMRGRAGDDELDGLAGNDTINGGSGADTLEGGDDDDRLSGGKDADDLSGEDGEDVLLGGIGDDSLDGGEGDDILRGGGGIDTLDGRQGHDVLEGGAGNDVVRGGNDNDTLRGGPGNDEMLGGAGDDAMFGASGNDVMSAAVGNDIADGGAGNDEIDGSLGDDHLAGGPGHDTIEGGDGTDTVHFAGPFAHYEIDVAGDDVLIGDEEPALPEGLNADEGIDTIRDVEMLVFADRTTNGDASNSFPVAAADKTLTVPQDSAAVVIGIAEPVDPDGDDIRIQVIELPDPAFGVVLDDDGEPVLIGDQPTIFELVRFTFRPDQGVSGDAGRFAYRIDDFEGGQDTQVITIDILAPDPGIIELDALNGINGFTLEGAAEDDELGSCVGGGQDIDADGFDDIVLGARFAGTKDQSGKAYVVFGGESHSARRVIDTSSDYAVLGSKERERVGISCTLTPDADGDDIADILLGARDAAAGDDLPDGAAYFLRGDVPRAGTLDLAGLTGTGGFRVEGHADEDFAGSTVAAAGDFNDDGLEDLLFAAPGVDAANAEERGEVYLLFGRDTLDENGLDLSEIDENNGLRLLGAARRDSAGGSAGGAADVNGDGIDDIVIGATYADPGGVRSGQAFVVFGSPTPSTDGVFSLADIDGINGFTIDGSADEMRAGFDVAGAGDVNGDGFADIIVGAPGLSTFGENMGGAFVVYGGEQVGADGSIDLATMTQDQGFVIRGVSSQDAAGSSVAAAGDFNNDGFDDVIVGAPGAEPHGAGSGAAYVVFGSAGGPANGVVELFELDGSDGIALLGGDAAHAGNEVAGAGDVDNDGFDDVVVAASSASPQNKPSGGEVYVVFGRATDASAGGQAVLSETDAASAAPPQPAPMMAASMLPAALVAATTMMWIVAGSRRLLARR